MTRELPVCAKERRPVCGIATTHVHRDISLPLRSPSVCVFVCLYVCVCGTWVCSSIVRMPAVPLKSTTVDACIASSMLSTQKDRNGSRYLSMTSSDGSSTKEESPGRTFLLVSGIHTVTPPVLPHFDASYA